MNSASSAIEVQTDIERMASPPGATHFQCMRHPVQFTPEVHARCVCFQLLMVDAPVIGRAQAILARAT